MSQKIRGSKTKEEISEIADKMGFPYTAKYLRKYGVDAWNPIFVNGLNDEVERFYKKCVMQNKKWNEVK